jgi:hypothetical protein
MEKTKKRRKGLNGLFLLSLKILRRCFERRTDMRVQVYGETTGRKPGQYDAGYLPEFVSADRYVDAKLKMLKCEMLIEPTDEEIAHLYELKTETAIDNAVHSIIARHWDEL